MFKSARDKALLPTIFKIMMKLFNISFKCQILTKTKANEMQITSDQLTARKQLHKLSLCVCVFFSFKLKMCKKHHG
jgi:hypothetical protein